MAFSSFNSFQTFLMYVRAKVSGLATFTYNFPALDPSLVLYYPLDSSANPSNGFQTANFASQLPVYDASLAGSAMITYAPNNSVTSFGDLSLNNTMGAQLVPQTVSGNYVVSNTSFALNISGGFSVSLWFSCSGQLNKTGTLISLPYQKTGNGIQIDISGPNMIYTGYNVPIVGQIDLLSTAAKTAMLGTSPVFTGSITGTTLNVTAITSGTISINSTLIGTGIIAGTQIIAFESGTGGVGTYTVSTSQNLTSRTITGKLSAGAYGVRLLYSGYTGPVIQIKAGTGGTPIDYYADTSGNLGTEYLGTGTPLATNLGVATAYVTKWYDQTGNKNDGTATANNITYNTVTKAVKFDKDNAVPTPNSGSFSLPDNAYPYKNSAFTYIFTLANYTTASQFLYGGGPGASLRQHRTDLNSGSKAIGMHWFGDGTVDNTNNSISGVKIAQCYNGTTNINRRFYYNNQLYANVSFQPVGGAGNQPSVRNQATTFNFLGRCAITNSFANYNGTLPYFYWAPTDLSVTPNDLTQLYNTPTN